MGNELEEEVPNHNSKYNLGYFEGRHQTKRWLSSKEDLMMMYRRYPPEVKYSYGVTHVRTQK